MTPDGVSAPVPDRTGTGDPAVSVLGLGPMGAPMARNLLRTYGPVTVWNRTEAKSRALVDLGAQPALTPYEAAAAVTLTVLPDLPQVESLMAGDRGLLAGWAAHGITAPVLVVHGTVSPVAVAAFAESVWSRHGVRVIDAPLSGGTIGATNATLSIMVGGHEPTARSLMPLFAHLGRTIRYLGPSGSGALAKICNQIVVAATVAALSEAMLLARDSGLDLNLLRELLQGGLARTEVLQQKGDNWLNESFEGGGSATNQLKDLRFAEEVAGARSLRLPTTERVTELFEHMVSQGLGHLDHTGLYRTIAHRSSMT